MALVHEKLYQTENLAEIDFRDYVDSLVPALFRAFACDVERIALTMSVEPVPLEIGQAVSCGLLVNELLSNALRHAFPTGRRGEIEIALRLLDDDWIELTVRDDGAGFPADVDFHRTDSLGLQLVATLAENQLAGRVELERTAGTLFRVQFPRTRGSDRT
jgi:two-component sensor histidine kinase